MVSVRLVKIIMKVNHKAHEMYPRSVDNLDQIGIDKDISEMFSYFFFLTKQAVPTFEHVTPDIYSEYVPDTNEENRQVFL